MADSDILNVTCVIAGGLIGSALLTLFPYFMEKNSIERQQAEIRKKLPEDRTPEENYILDTKPPGFFAEYKYRFFFGLLAGVGSALAFLQSGLEGIGSLTSSQALFAGITATGFFSALADKLRSAAPGSTMTPKPAPAAKAKTPPAPAPAPPMPPAAATPPK